MPTLVADPVIEDCHEDAGYRQGMSRPRAICRIAGGDSQCSGEVKAIQLVGESSAARPVAILDAQARYPLAIARTPGDAMVDDKPASTPKPRWSRRVRILGIFAILLVALIVVAPLILARTGLRDRAINAILASPSVTASSESASFGWLSPLAIRGLRLTSTNQRIDIRVNDIATDRSPWQLLASSPDLGTIKLEKPHVRLELPLDLKIEGHRRLEPTFTANVTGAALTVRVPAMNEPAIDVDGIDMTFRVEKADEGRVLTLDPMVVFDRRELSPKLGQKLLHLIDPTLGDAPQVAGKVSLSLEKLRIPIGIPRDQLAQRIEVEGKLRLHRVSTDVNNPMRQALVQLVADMNGKPVPDVVRLVEDAEIRFQVRDGRLHHEGLRIGFPDIDRCCN